MDVYDAWAPAIQWFPKGDRRAIDFYVIGCIAFEIAGLVVCHVVSWRWWATSIALVLACLRLLDLGLVLLSLFLRGGYGPTGDGPQHSRRALILVMLNVGEITVLYATLLRGLTLLFPTTIAYTPPLTGWWDAWRLSVGTTMTTGWGPEPATRVAILLSIVQALFGVLVLIALVSQIAGRTTVGDQK